LTVIGALWNTMMAAARWLSTYETAFQFFIAHQQLSETIEPAMRGFDDPARFASSDAARVVLLPVASLAHAEYSTAVRSPLGPDLPGISLSAHKCLLRRITGGGYFIFCRPNTSSSCLTSCRLAPVTMIDNGAPRNALQVIVFRQTGFSSRFEEAGALPLQKARVNRTATIETFLR
jgi:hypothetical protein